MNDVTLELIKISSQCLEAVKTVLGLVVVEAARLLRKSCWIPSVELLVLRRAGRYCDHTGHLVGDGRGLKHPK